MRLGQWSPWLLPCAWVVLTLVQAERPGDDSAAVHDTENHADGYSDAFQALFEAAREADKLTRSQVNGSSDSPITSELMAAQMSQIIQALTEQHKMVQDMIIEDKVKMEASDKELAEDQAALKMIEAQIRKLEQGVDESIEHSKASMATATTNRADDQQVVNRDLQHAQQTQQDTQSSPAAMSNAADGGAYAPSTATKITPFQRDGSVEVALAQAGSEGLLSVADTSSNHTSAPAAGFQNQDESFLQVAGNHKGSVLNIDVKEGGKMVAMTEELVQAELELVKKYRLELDEAKAAAARRREERQQAEEVAKDNMALAIASKKQLDELLTLRATVMDELAAFKD